MTKIFIPVSVLTLLIGISLWYFVGGGSDIKDFELDKEKQKFIWDTEHITFEIENYFGKPFAAAIKERDFVAAKKLVNESFVAEVGFETEAEETAGFAVRKSNAVKSDEKVDAEKWFAFFNDQVADFAEIERAKTRVLKIFAVDGEPNTWDIELLFTAHGKTKSKQPIKLSSHHTARFRYESDTEIQAGGTALSWKMVDAAVTESMSPLMREATDDYGLADLDMMDNWKLPLNKATQFHFQIATADFDNDGDMDIVAGTYQGLPKLFCMEKDKYVDRSNTFGLKTWEPGPTKSALAGWIDFDNDGFQDLVLGQYIYRNVRGLRFEDITESSGFKAGYDPHGMTVADYNGDGLLDIYISRSHTYKQVVDQAGWVGDNEAGAPNALWKNEGGGKFTDVTAEANVGGGNRTTFTSSWFFYDDDHLPDLYVANDFARNVVFRNKGDGTFEDVSEPSGAADFATSMGVATGDLDNDGTTEIYVANMYSKMGRRIISHVSDEDYPDGIFPQIKGSCAGNRLYRKSDNGDYTDVTDIAGVNEVGWAFAPLMCDFDGDGLLDIYATTGFMSFDRVKPDG